MEKAIAIVSGGIDSCTLLYDLLNQRFETYALTFVYGQKHSKEIEAAKRITSKLHVDHKIVDISAVKEILDSSALIGHNVLIPEVPESVEYYDTLKSTIVPNRNSIFLSLAIAYAVNIGANHVYYGAHASDRGVYPDCRREFVDAFAHAERLATDNFELTVEAPFVNTKKSDIVRLGSKLGVPFGITWSCYQGGNTHCGTCSSCRERRRAFVEAGIEDPTEYVQ